MRDINAQEELGKELIEKKLFAQYYTIDFLFIPKVWDNKFKNFVDIQNAISRL